MLKRILSAITAVALAFSFASCGKKEEKPFDELDILFQKHKDILTDEDKEYMRFIIEKRKKEIDKQLGED